LTYWPEFYNSRTIGNSKFPEDQKTMEPVDLVFGRRVGNSCPSNDYSMAYSM